MSKPNKYTYTILRYVHDIVAGEFVNVGVVMHSPSARQLSVRMRTTYGRLTRVFPTLDGDYFKRTLAHIEKAIARANEQFDDLFGPSGGNALDFAKRVLPHDDSAFQWAPLGSGVSGDLAEALDEIYVRMVTAHDEKPAVRTRTEDEVWRSFSRSLQTRQILGHLKTKEITSANDHVVFEHAWKNGVWHCLQPLSFDLVDGTAIREKALRWVGQAQALEGASEKFKLYLLIGQPKNPNVNEHYTRALKILDSMPGDKTIYLESQADELTEHIAKEIDEHSQNAQ